MDIEKLWEDCFKYTEIIYPDKSELLRGVNVELMPGLKKRIFYEQTVRSIIFNESFMAEVQVCNDFNSMLELMHTGIHECVHAISHQKNNKENATYQTGFCQTKIVNEVEVKQYKHFNEFMTDYLAFDIMDKTLDVKIAKSEWVEIPYIRIITELSSIVGMATMKKAYFDGKINEFKHRLKRKRPNFKKIIQSLEFNNQSHDKPSNDEILRVLKIISA